MSLIKYGMNWVFRLKIQSANGSLNPIDKSAFKNPELFSIKDKDGVIVECLIQKNYPKNVEYFKNIFC